MSETTTNQEHEMSDYGTTPTHDLKGGDTITRNGPIRAGEVILDSYANPAVVTSIQGAWVRYVQLAGSDHGHHESILARDVEARRTVTEAQVAWARRRYAELKAAGR